MNLLIITYFITILFLILIFLVLSPKDFYKETVKKVKSENINKLNFLLGFIIFLFFPIINTICLGIIIVNTIKNIKL